MKIHVSWYNITHNKRRTLASVAGIGFAILLIFLQFGFYYACKLNSTFVYDLFDFDAVIVSPYYFFIDEAESVPLSRLYQARAIQGIEDVMPLYLQHGSFRNKITGKKEGILVMGVDCRDQPFAKEGINNILGRLSTLDTALMDQETGADYGPHSQGTITEVADHRIQLVGEYRHGAGFISTGTMIVSDLTYSRLFKDASLIRPNFGLVRFSGKEDPKAVLARMRARLAGDDVAVWTKADLVKKDSYFLMNIKPIGIMFTSGAVFAFIVGAVILYQILSTEVSHLQKEYATLKAIGYTSGDLNRIVMEQSLLLVFLGFVPALGMAWYLYGMLRASVKIPMYMSMERIISVLILSLLMCTISGLIAVRKVKTADPADLF